MELSNYDNSNRSCYSAITNAINCGDYEECESSDSLMNIEYPICCTARDACYQANNITTSEITLLNSSFIDNTAIRCDWWHSCYVCDNCKIA